MTRIKLAFRIATYVLGYTAFLILFWAVMVITPA
jgi:hypothetical protein